MMLLFHRNVPNLFIFSLQPALFTFPGNFEEVMMAGEVERSTWGGINVPRRCLGRWTRPESLTSSSTSSLSSRRDPPAAAGPSTISPSLQSSMPALHGLQLNTQIQQDRYKQTTSDSSSYSSDRGRSLNRELTPGKISIDGLDREAGVTQISSSWSGLNVPQRSNRWPWTSGISSPSEITASSYKDISRNNEDSSYKDISGNKEDFQNGNAINNTRHDISVGSQLHRDSETIITTGGRLENSPRLNGGSQGSIMSLNMQPRHKTTAVSSTHSPTSVSGFQTRSQYLDISKSINTSDSNGNEVDLSGFTGRISRDTSESVSQDRGVLSTSWGGIDVPRRSSRWTSESYVTSPSSSRQQLDKEENKENVEIRSSLSGSWSSGSSSRAARMSKYFSSSPKAEEKKDSVMKSDVNSKVSASWSDGLDVPRRSQTSSQNHEHHTTSSKHHSQTEVNTETCNETQTWGSLNVPRRSSRSYKTGPSPERPNTINIEQTYTPNTETESWGRSLLYRYRTTPAAATQDNRNTEQPSSRPNLKSVDPPIQTDSRNLQQEEASKVGSESWGGINVSRRSSRLGSYTSLNSSIRSSPPSSDEKVKDVTKDVKEVTKDMKQERNESESAKWGGINVPRRTSWVHNRSSYSNSSFSSRKTSKLNDTENVKHISDYKQEVDTTKSEWVAPWRSRNRSSVSSTQGDSYNETPNKTVEAEAEPKKSETWGGLNVPRRSSRSLGTSWSSNISTTSVSNTPSAIESHTTPSSQPENQGNYSTPATYKAHSSTADLEPTTVTQNDTVPEDGITRRFSGGRSYSSIYSSATQSVSDLSEPKHEPVVLRERRTDRGAVRDNVMRSSLIPSNRWSWAGLDDPQSSAENVSSILTSNSSIAEQSTTESGYNSPEDNIKTSEDTYTFNRSIPKRASSIDRTMKFSDSETSVKVESPSPTKHETRSHKYSWSSGSDVLQRSQSLRSTLSKHRSESLSSLRDQVSRSSLENLTQSSLFASATDIAPPTAWSGGETSLRRSRSIGRSWSARRSSSPTERIVRRSASRDKLPRAASRERIHRNISTGTVESKAIIQQVETALSRNLHWSFTPASPPPERKTQQDYDEVFETKDETWSRLNVPRRSTRSRSRETLSSRNKDRSTESIEVKTSASNRPSRRSLADAAGRSKAMSPGHNEENLLVKQMSKSVREMESKLMDSRNTSRRSSQQSYNSSRSWSRDAVDNNTYVDVDNRDTESVSSSVNSSVLSSPMKWSDLSRRSREERDSIYEQASEIVSKMYGTSERKRTTSKPQDNTSTDGSVDIWGSKLEERRRRLSSENKNTAWEIKSKPKSPTKPRSPTSSEYNAYSETQFHEKQDETEVKWGKIDVPRRCLGYSPRWKTYSVETTGR